MLGALFAVIASATFGFNNATIRRGVLTASVIQGMSITVPLGAPLFLIAALASGQFFHLSTMSIERILFLAAAGMVHFVWGRYCNYRATKAIGANRSGPIQQTQTLVALALALLLLGESLNALTIIGIILVIIGPTIMIQRKSNKGSGSRPSGGARPAPAGGAGSPAQSQASTSSSSGSNQQKPVWTPNVVEGYIFALLSSTGYGVSPILIRAGLRGEDLSMLGGFISYGAAAVLITAIIIVVPGNLRHVASIDRKTVPWFTLSGFTVFFSQMFRYIALSIAPVTIVAPLMRLSIVFRSIFSYLMNREYESFEGRVMWGIAISLVGAVALALNVDVIANNLPLPHILQVVANWRWP